MRVVTIIGAGVIGISWARLFAEKGWEVRVTDPRPDLEDVLSGIPAAAIADPVAALAGADMVQECGPERIEVKRELFAAAAAHASPDAVLASSSSSLLPSEIAEHSPAADRLLVGHPFNPPHLMPLVEVVPSPATSSRIVDRAIDVYRELGRRPVRLQREISGFVGNRLQKVFQQEAAYLVQQGVIDPAQLDELVRASLGLRWASVGPFESSHLGGGPGGIRHLAEHVASQMRFETPGPDPERMGEVHAAVEAAYGVGEDAYRELAVRRDRRTRGVLDALAHVDASEGTETSEHTEEANR